MCDILFQPDSQGSGSSPENKTPDIVAILQDDNNRSDQYDRKIAELERSIQDVQSVIIEHTAPRSQYQDEYNTKMSKIKILQQEYVDVARERMSEEERTVFEQDKKQEEEMWQAIFNSMGFGGAGARGNFTSEEDFFENHKKEQKDRADANYVKKNMEEVKGELVDQIKDLPLKTIYRKISLLIHADKLEQNPEIAGHDDYIAYLHNLHLKIINSRKKEDKAAMISLIQEAGICYIDDNFVLSSYADFQQIGAQAYKKELIEGLQDRLNTLKTSYLYMFYLKYENGDIQKELRDLDDEIQELKDLITSYTPIQPHE